MPERADLRYESKEKRASSFFLRAAAASRMKCFNEKIAPEESARAGVAWGKRESGGSAGRAPRVTASDVTVYITR